jgi:flagellar basal body rod protein FlgB
MFSSLFGVSTTIGTLRTGLDESSQAHRAIAGRVANALDSSANGDFDSQLQAQVRKQQAPVDLETEMVKLASTQLRYDAGAKLLQKAYANLRVAVSDRG